MFGWGHQFECALVRSHHNNGNIIKVHVVDTAMTFRKEYNNGNGHTPFDLVKCIKKYSTHNNGNTQNGMNDGMIFSAQHINGNETAVGWSRCDANLHLFIIYIICPTFCANKRASEHTHTTCRGDIHESSKLQLERTTNQATHNDAKRVHGHTNR